MSKKLLPTYRLDRRWFSVLLKNIDGSILLISGTKSWTIPAFNIFSWKSISNRIVFWMAKRQGKFEKINR